MSDAISGLSLSGAGQITDLLAGKLLRGPRTDPSQDPPASLGAGKADKDHERGVQAAKDFESVLIHKLLSEMRNTVPDSGLLRDGTSKQIESMFWMFLSQHVANNGGLGLWKEIYRQAVEADGPANRPATVEQLL